MNRAAGEPEVHVHIGRLVVDAALVEPGRDGLRRFEARVIEAITRQLMDAASSSGSTAEPQAPGLAQQVSAAVASAAVPAIQPHLARASAPTAGARHE